MSYHSRGFREDRPLPRDDMGDSRGHQSDQRGMYSDHQSRGQSPPRSNDDRGYDNTGYDERYGGRGRDRSRSPDRGRDRDGDRDRDSRRDRSRERDGKGGGKGDGQGWSGANGLRSLTGYERLDYYQKRLGDPQPVAEERGGLGYSQARPSQVDDGERGYDESKAIQDMKRLAQGGTDLVQEIMRKSGRGGEESYSRSRVSRDEFDPFSGAPRGENLDGEPVEALGSALEGLTPRQQQVYMQRQMEQHQDLQEQQHHAAGHPLLRGDTVFSAAAQDDYVQRMTARTSNDLESLKNAMKDAVVKEDFEEAGRLKRRIETVLTEQAGQRKAKADAEKASGKKKGSFMAKQLAKIKKVKTQNDQQRTEDEHLASLDGAHGDYQRFMKELEQTACHSSGARGDDFFAISCNTHRIV